MITRIRSTFGSAKRPGQKGGFTLIATILVLCLLSILVVAATVVAQVEEQAQYMASRQEVARQNALFGLNQALNQLQTAAGPDRRVTARADILNTNSVPLPTANGYFANQPQIDSGQSYWTGVWKNTNNDFSGCAGNGLVANPDSSPNGSPGPGGSFLYYDYLPTGQPNTTPPTTPLSPTQGLPPSRAQLYYNSGQTGVPSNVTWLISWPASAPLPPDPTQTLANQNLSTVLPTRGGAVPLTGANQLATVMKNLCAKTSANTRLQSSSLASISVPKVPILASQPGGNGNFLAVGVYAYWVGDEGIKARVDTPDPYMTVTPSSGSTYLQSQAHFQIAQSSAGCEALAMNSGSYIGTSLATPAGTTSSAFQEGNALDIRANSVMAPTLASLGWADPNMSWSDLSSNPNTYSSDLTVYSLGVIADNFNGGLRRDLTAAFENQTIYWNQFSNVNGSSLIPEPLQKLYSINSISGGQTGVTNYDTICLDGMRWDSLFLYYNLYKAQLPSPCQATSSYGYGGIGSGYADGVPGTANANLLPTLPARIYEEFTQKNSNDTLTIDPIIPKVLSWTHSVSLGLNQLPPPIAAGTYDLQFYGNSNLVLYNPWNVNLQEPNDNIHEGCIRLWTNIDSVNAVNDYNIFTVNNIGNPGFTSSGSITATPPGVLGGSDVRTSSAIGDPPILPGEIRAYGLISNKTLTPQLFSASFSSAFPSTVNNLDANSASEELSSLGYNNSCYQVFEATLPFNLQASQNNSIYMAGTNNLEESKAYVCADYFPTWPSGSSTQLVQDTVVQSHSFPPISPTATPTPVLVGRVSSLIGAPSTKPVIVLVDRVPGIYNQTSKTAFPGFVSGGAFLNPLATEQNGAARDFSSSGKMSSSLTASTPAFTEVTASSANYTDTEWLPDSVGREGPNRNIILRDVPRQPPLSLGQFKNMDCHYWGSNECNFSSLDFSFYPLGGSYQACLPPNQAFVVTAASTSPISFQHVYLDDNFLANESLFDGYFLSTVPPSSFNSSDGMNWPISTTAFSAAPQTYINNNQPLPNSRFVYYNRVQSNQNGMNGNPPSPYSLAPNSTDLQALDPSSGLVSAKTSNIRKPAANLLIAGAFNINSTSVPAWEALLSSGCSPNPVEFFNTSAQTLPLSVNASTFTFPSYEVGFLNFSTPIYIEKSPSSVVISNPPFFGLIQTTTHSGNSAMASLAANIVGQVQMRGPFFSLGDFLNHRLSATANALSNSGALQAAIDATPSLPNSSVASNVNVDGQPTTGFSSINNSISVPTVFPSGGTFSPVQPPAPNNSAYGIPGTLMQNDLVQEIAPAIAARSDTFIIRAYGEAINPATGQTEATAYCEAVVQRFPEYMYSLENGQTDSTGAANFAYDDPAAAPLIPNASGVAGLTGATCAFGRRFKIISIRWLNQNEI